MLGRGGVKRQGGSSLAGQRSGEAVGDIIPRKAVAVGWGVWVLWDQADLIPVDYKSELLLLMPLTLVG